MWSRGEGKIAVCSTVAFQAMMKSDDKLFVFQEKYCIISSLDSHIYRGEIGSVKEKCYHCDATQDVSI